jgi:hypothetical protein
MPALKQGEKPGCVVERIGGGGLNEQHAFGGLGYYSASDGLLEISPHEA